MAPISHLSVLKFPAPSKCLTSSKQRVCLRTSKVLPVCMHEGRPIFHEKIPDTLSDNCFIFPCSWREETLTWSCSPRHGQRPRRGRQPNYYSQSISLTGFNVLCKNPGDQRLNSAWATRAGLEEVTTLPLRLTDGTGVIHVICFLDYNCSEANMTPRKVRARGLGPWAPSILGGNSGLERSRISLSITQVNSQANSTG